MKRFTSRKIGSSTVRCWHDRALKGQFNLALEDSAVQWRDTSHHSIDEFTSRGTSRGFAVALDWGNPLSALAIAAQRDIDDPIRQRIMGA